MSPSAENHRNVLRGLSIGAENRRAVDDVVTGWWRTFSVHSFCGLIHSEVVSVLISRALNIGVSKVLKSSEISHSCGE